MRLKFVFPLVAALAAVMALQSPARAAHCGASAYPAACCPDSCCYPKVRYKTCWQTVVEDQTRVCYKNVYKTVMKECRYTVCKPVYETVEKECRYTVCKPVYTEETIPCKQIICKPVWEEGVREVTECTYQRVEETCYRECVRKVCKQVTEMRTVTKCVRDCHTEQYCCPGHKHLRLVK